MGKKNYGKQLPVLVLAHAITALRVCKAPKMHGPNCPPAPSVAPPPPALEALSTSPPCKHERVIAGQESCETAPSIHSPSNITA